MLNGETQNEEGERMMLFFKVASSPNELGQSVMPGFDNEVIALTPRAIMLSYGPSYYRRLPSLTPGFLHSLFYANYNKPHQRFNSIPPEQDFVPHGSGFTKKVKKMWKWFKEKMEKLALSVSHRQTPCTYG
ncbi:hypothetical protein ACO22_04266 [Paracoccidioides brasiliensis]|uniref:Uncharacterized protein n=1 Tax=Paracoccidioides brasiliensis TaxID=121759 RepID=A0A1D2JDT4_PARBR|nr:hypothetical protein ACO22_04266 [Paracoccidioides brasiliensis]